MSRITKMFASSEYQDDHAPLWSFVKIKEKIGDGGVIGCGVVIFVKKLSTVHTLGLKHICSKFVVAELLLV